MEVPEKLEDITLEWFNSIFHRYGIKVHEFTLAGDASKGRGEMGSLEEVHLKVSYFNGFKNSSVSEHTTDAGRLSVILKMLPKDPFRKAFVANDGFSSRELSMYTEILKSWDEFLDIRQVPLTNRFRYPRCFYGAEQGHRETYKYILVLEHLTSPNSNFRLWAPGFSEPLPWIAASAVIKQIARFHATGIAYKLENQINSYCYKFEKLNHPLSPSFQHMWETGFIITKDVIKTTLEPNEIPEGLLERLDQLCENEGRDLLLKWVSDPTMDTTNKATICHHDLHSYNLVLSNDQSEAVLFDFQASCVFNPMKDLSFFLILNCSTEDSIANLPRALKLYHDEFETTIKALNVEFKYDLESIRKDYDHYLVFSLAHVMTGIQFWVTGKDSTEASKRRFAIAIVDAFKRGILTIPTEVLL